MADIGLKYAAAVAFVVTALQSLASSATRIAGWSSAAVDNGSDNYLDFLVSGQFQVAAAGLSDKKTISVYAYVAHDGGTPIWPDLFSSGTEGSQGAATVHKEEQRDCGMRLLWSCITNTDANGVYVMPPTSIADAFGGIVPRQWALFVVHDTGAALAASGNALYYTPIEGVSA